MILLHATTCIQRKRLVREKVSVSRIMDVKGHKTRANLVNVYFYFSIIQKEQILVPSILF